MWEHTASSTSCSSTAGSTTRACAGEGGRSSPPRTRSSLGSLRSARLTRPGGVRRATSSDSGSTKQAVERSRRSGLSAAVFAIDLNGFKAINDTLGHHTGDVVLMRVADRLKRSIRGADTVARCGGDEFLVIVNDLARAESCAQIAQTLRSGIESVTIPGYEQTGARPLKLGGSIGFALYPEEATDEAALCELADQRMYDEKQARGRAADARTNTLTSRRS